MLSRNTIIRKSTLSIAILGTFVFLLFPIYWVTISSLKSGSEIFMFPPSWIPKSLMFENYIKIPQYLPLGKWILNTIYVSSGTTVLAVAISSFTAYGLSRFRFRARIPILSLILFTEMIPGVLILVPLYFFMMNLGLLNSYAGLVVGYTVWSIPFSTLMLRSYFSTAIPVEIEEAGLIDGLGRLGVYTRIALPLAAPGVVATAIFSWLLAWNEFMWASVILTGESLRTLQVGINLVFPLHATQTVSPGIVNAAAVVTMVPSIVLFLFLQKYVVEGMTAGAVKG